MTPSIKSLLGRLKELKTVHPNLRHDDRRTIDAAVEKFEELLDGGLEADIDAAREEGIRIAIEWIRIRSEEEEYFPDIDAGQLETDVDHSIRGGLLEWMLEGNDPLDEAPPRFLSRPAHGLISEGEATLGKPLVSYHDAESALGDTAVFYIGQYEWEVLDEEERNGQTVFRITWQTGEEEPESIWEIHRTTYPVTSYDPDEEDTKEITREGWQLTRVEAAD